MAKDGEKFKTYGGVFDNFTNRRLFVIEGKGLFDEIKSHIFVGKEAHVFAANKDDHKVIIKIYRLETCDFNRMYDYIKHDKRYQTLRKHKRKVIFAWAQREYRNLLIARESGARVPTPLLRDNHILILEYIGDEEGPSPPLKDAFIEDPNAVLDDIIRQVKLLYKKNLIHADLSSFNILLKNQKPVIIDFSQSTTKENPRAEEYLKRDIHNLCQFFKKHGVVRDEEAIFKEITSPKPLKPNTFPYAPHG